MSEIKSDKLSPATGTAMTLGDSGDTFTIPSGVTFANSGTATGFGGGKVLQVVYASDIGTNTTTTSTSFINTGTTASITCSLTSSKVLVIIGGSSTGKRSSDTNQYNAPYRIKESTTTDTFPTTDYFQRATVNAGSGSHADNRLGAPSHGIWLHSPSSTSALTYTVQVKNIYTSAAWNETSQETAYMVLMEIGA